MKMRALFITLFLLLPHLGACTLCAFYTPTADVTIRFETQKEQLLNAKISWFFSERFTEEIIRSHDADHDGKLNEQEIGTTRKAFYDYLSVNHFLTELSLTTEEGITRKLPIRIASWEFRFVDNKPFLEYTIDINEGLTHETGLNINFWDEGNYFDFLIQSSELRLPPQWHIEQQVGPKNIDYYIYDRNRFIAHAIERGDQEKGSLQTTPPAEVQKSQLILLLEQWLKTLSNTINAYINDINKEGSFLSYFWLLLFSLLYGIVHAAGPGHGKSLVASYFLANDHDYTKAFGVATLIAVVHTFSAFVSTLIIYFILNMFFAQFFQDLTYFTTKISAVLIITIALYLLYKKLPKKKGTKWLTHPPECGCGACNTDSGTTELGIIVGAGIIPCPGTVTIFMLTLSLGEYFVGFLSALFMSIGMSIIILTAALLSIGVRKKATARFTWLRTLLDYGSLLFIMMLGLALMFVDMR